jgi:hypothetical protein
MDEDSNFVSLAAAVANVLAWLELGHHHEGDSQRKTGGERENEQQPEHHVDDVESSLKKRTAL